MNDCRALSLWQANLFGYLVLQTPHATFAAIKSWKTNKAGRREIGPVKKVRQ